MKKLIVFTLFLINALLITGASAETALTKEQILIQDGKLTITKEDAELLLQDMNKPQKEKILSDPEKLKNLLLDLLVLKKRAQAARDKKLEQDKLMQWKIKNKTDELLSAQLVKQFQDTIKLPDSLEQLAKDQYDAHPEKYTTPEQISAAHILISRRSNSGASEEELQNKAKEVLKKIKDGMDFAEAAKEYSDDKSNAPKGGELGFFRRGQMVTSFENAAFALKSKGDLSDIVESQFGYHIIKLLDRKKATPIPFDKVKKGLLDKQKKNYIHNKTENYLKEFGVTDKTNIFMPALNKVYKEARNKM